MQIDRFIIEATTTGNRTLVETDDLIGACRAFIVEQNAQCPECPAHTVTARRVTSIQPILTYTES